MVAGTPAVSVIIPTYNRGHFIGEAVGSVLGQDYPSYEVIVVDDGSTDETCEVARQFPPPVFYFRQDNHGRSHARNQGIARSRGRYLLFLDSDDLLLPCALATLADFLDNHPNVGVVYGDGVFFDDCSGRELRHVSDRRPTVAGRTWLEVFAISNVIDAINSAMVRREWLDCLQYPNFDESLTAAEDLDLWTRLASVGCQFEALDALVCKCRVHDRNTYSPISPGFQLARAARLRQRQKVFSSGSFPFLSSETQRVFLYDWLVGRDVEPEEQQAVLRSRRFSTLEPSVQASIAYYVGVENVLDGRGDLGRPLLELAARACPKVAKYQLIRWLARFGMPPLVALITARRWFGHLMRVRSTYPSQSASPR